VHRSIGKQSGESVEKKKRKGYSGKDLQKRKVLSLKWKSEGVMDDEWWVDGTDGGNATQKNRMS